MYIKNSVRRAVAAAALATSAAIAVGAVGAAQADSRVTPDAGSTDVAPGRSTGDTPPGSGLGGEARPAAKDVTVVDQYEVVGGDSFWAIAERQLPDGATAREVLTVTKVLMDYNAPRLGHGDPAMLTPGDVVDVVATPSDPVAVPTAQPASFGATMAPDSYTVVAGDSYWEIAESIVGDEATPSDVLDKTEELIEINSARLGYEDPQMLRPGDVVFVQDVASTTYVPVDEGADTEVAGTKDAVTIDSKPAAVLTSKVSPDPKTTDWTTPWTRPLATGDQAEARQTPTSPPLPESALNATETISPLKPATSGSEPFGKPTRAGRDDLHRDGERPSAPPPPAATPANASAS
jgi:LysM repeat protein